MSILELQNVEKIYGEKENQVKALRNINLQVEEGEFVAIVGTSGSGKSTLLNLIGALDNPTRGKIFIKKREIGSLSRKELTIFRRRNIGFVFQNYSLMPVLTNSCIQLHGSRSLVSSSALVFIAALFRGCSY